MNADKIEKNTTPEAFDDVVVENDGDKPVSKMEREEILMSEKDILAGLLALGNTKDDSENYRKVQIKRKGVRLLEFRVRPISEDENQKCFKQATRYAPSKPGQPKKPIETDQAKYRSFIIYTATVDDDRAKVWDNREAMNQLDVMQGVDMIDRVLIHGEKERVLDVINEISGFGDDMEELAKN